MAYPDYVQFGLDNYLKLDALHLQAESMQYILEEKSEKGYTKLTVIVSMPNLCMTSFDEVSSWNIVKGDSDHGMKKGVDHVILTMDAEGEWKVHLIEMKTSMGEGTFRDVKTKVRADYFKVKAICMYLGIPLFDENIMVYVTYEQEKLGRTPCHTENPATLKAQVGEKYESLMHSEWNQDKISVATAKKQVFHLKKIRMCRESSDNLQPSVLVKADGIPLEIQ